MFFAIAATALVAFIQIAHGTPLAPVSAAVKPDVAGVTTAALFPVHELSPAGARIPDTVGTSPASAFQALHSDVAQQTFPATLLLCPSANCASCFGFDLSTLPVNVCLTTSAFSSVAISQPSNEGLPFGVLVGPPGCLSFAQIPIVNQCFNVNGGPFTDFALVE